MCAIRYPSRRRRAKSRFTLSTDSPTEQIIELYAQSTATSVKPECLQAPKCYQAPNLTQRAEQLERQMHSLNNEVRYYRQIEPHRREFIDRVERAGDELKDALFQLGRIQRQIDKEWIQSSQGQAQDSKLL